MPFFVIGLADVILVAVVRHCCGSEIPFVGNPLVLLLGTSLFLLSTLGLGLLISTLCTTQQQAFATNFFVLNPMFTLSGFSFPIASMPQPLQWLTYLNPLRYYPRRHPRDVPQGRRLCDSMAADSRRWRRIAAVLLTLCILRFRKSLE